LFRFVCRDALIVTAGDTLTSVYVGFAIFAVLGFLANEVGTTVDAVASHGKTFINRSNTLFDQKAPAS